VKDRVGLVNGAGTIESYCNTGFGQGIILWWAQQWGHWAWTWNRMWDNGIVYFVTVEGKVPNWACLLSLEEQGN